MSSRRSGDLGGLIGFDGEGFGCTGGVEGADTVAAGLELGADDDGVARAAGLLGGGMMAGGAPTLSPNFSSSSGAVSVKEGIGGAAGKAAGLGCASLNRTACSGSSVASSAVSGGGANSGSPTGRESSADRASAGGMGRIGTGRAADRMAQSWKIGQVLKLAVRQ